MNIRHKIFMLIDRLKGSKIAKDFYQIASHISNNKTFSSIQLNKLLEYATENIQAYHDYKGFKSLNDFPVVNKIIMRNSMNSYLSQLYDKNNLASATTSGSTGTPFTIYYDRRKVARKKAALMYWNSRANAPLGTRIYYMRVWNKLNKKSHIRQFIENIFPIEVAQFGLQETQNLLHRINKQRHPIVILGFASAIIEFYKNLKYRPSNLKGIISMSEHLPTAIRHSCQEMCGCPVYSRYSNMENGFIAQQFDETEDYLINSADFVVEILELERDKQVPEGQKGRIVITDLYNYAMPFIRYDTGDIGSIATRNDGKLVFKSIEGRKTDIIKDTIGNIISPHIVTNTMWEYPEVSQFQFIQKGQKEYIIKLNLNGENFDNEIALRNSLLNYLGKDASISFEYVEEIPVLSSGKRRYIVNEYSL